MTEFEKFIKDASPPNWDYWRQMKYVSIREAIELSLGINPNWSYGDPYDLDLHSWFDSKSGITERLSVAHNWGPDESWYVPSVDDIPKLTQVELRGFIGWAINQVGWSIPDEFQNLSLPKATANKSRQVLSSQDWKELAKKYALEIEDKSLTLERLSEIISNRFSKELIVSAHAGGKEITLATMQKNFSDQGWFTTVWLKNRR
jgi:hypothetical protein